MPLLSLGWFTFSVETAPFKTIKRSTEQRWTEKSRVGEAPAYQHLGPGADTITLDGSLAPEISGGASNLDRLREMMASGNTWILTAGTGEVLGQWFITNVEETREKLFRNGAARHIPFSLTLKRYPDEDAVMLGKLPASTP